MSAVPFGAPVARGMRGPMAFVRDMPLGYATLSVIDAAGAAARTEIMVRD